MKLLIKTLIVGIIVIVLGLYFGLTVYGKALVSNMASRILHTDVEISEVKFVPKRLALQLYRVNIPKWKMMFPKGIVYLVPLKVNLQGLEIMRELLLLEDRLSLRIDAKDIFSKSRIWEANMTFKSINLVNLSSIWTDVWSYGFSNGTLDGTINGTFSGKECELYGLLHFYNMVYSESGAIKPNGPLGIPMGEIIEYIRDNNGSIDLDFTYEGPLSELNNPFRYRPGPKIIRALGTYLIKKVS